MLLLGWALHVWEETLLLLTSTWLYNDLGGSDENWVLRNSLIALGYGLYSSAALRVMAGPEHALTTSGFHWVLVVALVMLCTQHICDIKDAEGDRVRGRRSAPVVLGDELVRWSVAVPIVLSSLFCPAFFGLSLTSFVVTVSSGSFVAFRSLAYRNLKSDKVTWKLWALWTCGLFVLPLVKNPAVLFEMWGDLKGCFCFDGECLGALNLAAVSGVALVVEGRRVFTQVAAKAENRTVPEIRVEGVAA